MTRYNKKLKKIKVIGGGEHDLGGEAWLHLIRYSNKWKWHNDGF